MWSLYKKSECEDSVGEGIFGYSGEKLEPLKFSNGKTQESVVKEIYDAIGSGSKIIFVKGVCGSGKSAIALNLAKNFDKTSIVVPIKSLQKQYEEDYSKNKFILKDDKKMLNISVIKGRNNFRCPFTFNDETADNPDLPCTIDLREKNAEKIKEYLEMNKNAEADDFGNVSDVKRMNVAAACPYWAPLMPADANPKLLDDFRKVKYDAVCGKEFALFQRKKGCGYCDQYVSYAKSDVLIFNSMKYLIEIAIGRKPKTDLDIIDECDEFLDSFAVEKKINLNRLFSALSNLVVEKQEDKNFVKELIHLVNDVIYDKKKSEEIYRVGDTKIVELIEKVLKNPYLAMHDDKNYYNSVVETAVGFKDLLSESYVSFEYFEGEQRGLFGSSSDENVIVNLVSINLAQRFKEIAESSKALVLMSGTLHSEQVLKDVFGLENFKVIEAETEAPGKIEKVWTGLEKACSYANFKSGVISRKGYLKALDVCMANSTQPTLVHVAAFKDLPTEVEQDEFKFDNLITQEKLRELQSFGGRNVEEFSNREADVLFTTKCSRGVDFAGDKCNSIVLTRYPYPNLQSLFWKILRKEQPEKFREFYMDKARRELIQKIMRGVRFKGDKVFLLSPDVRVLRENFD